LVERGLHKSCRGEGQGAHLSAALATAGLKGATLRVEGRRHGSCAAGWVLQPLLAPSAGRRARMGSVGSNPAAALLVSLRKGAARPQQCSRKDGRRRRPSSTMAFGPEQTSPGHLHRPAQRGCCAGGLLCAAAVGHSLWARLRSAEKRSRRSRVSDPGGPAQPRHRRPCAPAARDPREDRPAVRGRLARPATGPLRLARLQGNAARSPTPAMRCAAPVLPAGAAAQLLHSCCPRL
jgi:hypothetical protein